jgi:anti-sigma B factor antagonist
MAVELKHLQLEDADGITIVGFVDSNLIFETALIEEVGHELQSLLTERGCKKILIDFDRVQYLSSSMLAQLTKLAKEAARDHCQLKLTGLGPVLKDAFRISHFDSFFDIHESKGSAVKSFRA